MVTTMKDYIEIKNLNRHIFFQNVKKTANKVHGVYLISSAVMQRELTSPLAKKGYKEVKRNFKNLSRDSLFWTRW
jgi:hypothetical protein